MCASALYLAHCLSNTQSPPVAACCTLKTRSSSVRARPQQCASTSAAVCELGARTQLVWLQEGSKELQQEQLISAAPGTGPNCCHTPMLTLLPQPHLNAHTAATLELAAGLAGLVGWLGLMSLFVQTAYLSTVRTWIPPTARISRLRVIRSRTNPNARISRFSALILRRSKIN